jgi:hypothetical protein
MHVFYVEGHNCCEPLRQPALYIQPTSWLFPLAVIITVYTAQHFMNCILSSAIIIAYVNILTTDLIELVSLMTSVTLAQ